MKRSSIRHAIGTGLAVLLVVSNAMPTLGTHIANGLPRPTIGASTGSLTANQSVSWKFGASGYPAWVTTAFEQAIENNASNISRNNSKSPDFNGPISTGTAKMFYSAALLSPCSNSSIWIQCTKNGTTTNIEIYIRDFVGAPLGSLGWYEKNGNCIISGTTPYSECHFAKRALMHEVGHAVSSLDHDGQGHQWTVMGATNPCTGASCDDNGSTNWDWPYYLECDEAAAQLIWDVEDTARAYADCFQNVANHATSGNLKTTLTVAGSSFAHVCSSAQPVSGRLEIFNDATNYKLLAANPLTLRVVRMDRKRSVDTVWTLNAHTATATSASGNNWTSNITFPAVLGLWNYRAHFDGGVGLASSAQIQFTINWTSAAGCPT
jgi:hypothetical protein